MPAPPPPADAEALSPTAATALRAAHAAADVHRRFFRRLDRVDYKGRNNPVTEADRAAEAAILRVLSDSYPSYAVLAEESGQHGRAPQTWLVDPLDGTSNYARGIPWFCVSIGLRDDAAGMVTGVILNPILGEVYAAERGRGAFAASLGQLPPDPGRWADLSAWRRLKVSGISTLADAGFATGFPHDVTETRINIDHFVNIRLETAVVRALGSAALGLAQVAAGQLEGYWEIGPKAWDFAAGMLLVAEAGGRVSDLRGRPLAGPGEGQLLATNGVIHDAAVAVFARGRSGLG
ncbi:MAG TPA: inositol monophosphatase family protein [bacterium]|nr:inositol monophosphatase family protein [bacterium]